MSKHAAHEQELGELHASLAKKYKLLLKTTEDPRVLNGIAKFLNDNGIKADPFDDAGLTELEQDLRNRTRRFAEIAEEAKASATDSIH